MTSSVQTPVVATRVVPAPIVDAPIVDAPIVDAPIVAAVSTQASTPAPDTWVAARAATAFAVLGLILPLIIASQAHVSFSPAYALIWVVALHAAMGLSTTLSSTSLRPLHLGFWAYTYCFFGLAGIAQVGSGTYPTGLHYVAGPTLLSIVIVEAGQLAFTAGSWLQPRLRSARPARRFGTDAETETADRADTGLFTGRTLSRNRVVGLSCVVLVALVVGVVKVLPHYGGVGILFTSRQATHDTVDQAGAADSTISLITWGISVPAFWALLGLLRAPGLTLPGPRWLGIRRRPWWSWTLLGAVVAANVLVNNPISRPRFWAGTVILTLVFSTPRLRRPTSFRVGAAAFLALLVIVFPYADYFRYTNAQQVQRTSAAGQFEQKLDYDSLSQVQVGLNYVEQTGFHPRAVAGPALFWVPRADWPNKPQDTGILLSNWVGYTLTNRSAPLWIESYIWGGVGVVVVVFLLLGLLWRRLDDAFDRARRRHPDALLLTLIPLLGFFEIIVLRGSLLQSAAPMFLTVLIPLAISTRSRR